MSVDLTGENRPLAVALGALPTWKAHVVAGRRATAEATFNLLWNKGGVYPYPTSAQTIKVVSTSTADDGAPPGTGALTGYIAGLDANWDEIDETFTYDGTTEVTLTKQYIRIRKLTVLTAGSGLANVGVITAYPTGAAASVLAQIDVGDNHSNQCAISCPRLYRLALYDPAFGWNNTASARYRVREFGGVFQSRAHYEGLVMTGGPGMLAVPRAFPAKCDVELQAFAAAAGVSAEFLAVLVPDA